MRLSALNGSSPRATELPLQLPDRRRAGTGSRVSRSVDELERPEHALAAHLADERVPLGELGEARGRSRPRRSRRAFSTMPSVSIASIDATMDAAASGCPL